MSTDGMRRNHLSVSVHYDLHSYFAGSMRLARNEWINRLG